MYLPISPLTAADWASIRLYLDDTSRNVGSLSHSVRLNLRSGDDTADLFFLLLFAFRHEPVVAEENTAAEPSARTERLGKTIKTTVQFPSSDGQSLGDLAVISTLIERAMADFDDNATNACPLSRDEFKASLVTLGGEVARKQRLLELQAKFEGEGDSASDLEP